jgi:hypothetical protein
MNGRDLARRLLEDEEINPRDYLHSLTRDDLSKDGELIYVRYNAEEPDNPFVRCPNCAREGTLMNDFSYLCGGFNGIENGDPDDLDLQECGCGAKLGWDDVVKKSEEEAYQKECEEMRRLNGGSR